MYVSFLRQLLLKKHFELFEKWMFKFSKEIIVLSSKYPLISGFYKLNTLCMKIAIRIGYFSVSELTLTLTNPSGRSTFTVSPGSPHSLQKNMNETSKKLNSFLNQSTRTTTAEAQMETDGDDNDEDEEGNDFVEPDTITRTAAAAGDTSSSFNDSSFKIDDLEDDFNLK